MRTHLRTAGIAVSAAVASAALLFAPAAGANHLESGMAISIGASARLVDGVYLDVPVTVTCPPLGLSPTQWVNNESISVQVTQKAGRFLTSGYGQTGFWANGPNGPFFGTPLTCDGAPHTYSVSVLPQPLSNGALTVAFKGGKAVLSASLSIFIQDSSTFQGDGNNASLGPVSISIKR